MQVNHGGAEVAVARQFLDSVQVATGIREVCCKRMPQRMGRIIFTAQTYFGDVCLHKMLDAPFMHWFSFYLPFKQVSLGPELFVVCTQWFQ